jgi:integrase/recombinase XerC
MDSTTRIESVPGIAGEVEHGPYIEALKRYLTERRHAGHTVHSYVNCAGRFLRWTQRERLDLVHIDEGSVARFADEHLRADRREAHAAIGHLLVVLRTLGITAARPIDATPVDEELRRFDDHMDRVRGLAPRTRRAVLRIVREFLRWRFRDRPVVIPAIKPEHVRSCFVRLTERCHAPASVGAVVSALRGYFRYRATYGDTVYHLIGVLSYPANWQQASLPQTLGDEEVRRLLYSLDSPSPTMRRTAAIVRCAVDLGLRSGEIAALSLDDINWRDGVVTLRKTKGRREQLLPLPEPTGRAIVDYLRYERPKTRHRGLFLRRAAPQDEPIGPDGVRKIIRLAYQRAGLPYTRSHLLRHTIARRLLDGGSSLKEVADVLRHRSLNTTLVYAKLDGRNLRSVALPWPGRRV